MKSIKLVNSEETEITFGWEYKSMSKDAAEAIVTKVNPPVNRSLAE